MVLKAAAVTDIIDQRCIDAGPFDSRPHGDIGQRCSIKTFKRSAKSPDRGSARTRYYNIFHGDLLHGGKVLDVKLLSCS
jgi:hypothetical protein